MSIGDLVKRMVAEREPRDYSHTVGDARKRLATFDENDLARVQRAADLPRDTLDYSELFNHDELHAHLDVDPLLWDGDGT